MPKHPMVAGVGLVDDDSTTDAASVFGAAAATSLWRLTLVLASAVDLA